MSTETTATGAETQNGSLRTGTLGVAAIVFFVVATVGPMSAVVGGVPLAFALGPGEGIPGLFVFVAILLVLFSVGYTAMSRYVVSAGGFYVYIGAAFGPRVQRAAGAVALFSYHALILALWALLAMTSSSFLSDMTGWNVSWIVIMVLGLALVGVLGRRDINLNANVLGVLMLAEVAVIAIMDVVVLAKTPGSDYTLAPFKLDNVFSGDVGAGFMFCVVVFIGFEATAIYSEEAREPRKTIPRAAYVAIGVIAVFHVVTAWTVVLHYGPSNVQNAALADPSNFIYNVADATIGGAYVDVMKVLFITSTFAACLGVHNALSRYQFSLARDGVLPNVLTHTHPEWKSPHHSSLSQTLFAIGTIILLWAFGVEPMTVFALLLAIATFGLIVLMAALCVAVVFFFIRDHRDESLWSRLIAPAVAGAGFLTVIVLLLQNRDIQTGSTGWVAQHLPWAIPILAVVGFLLPGRQEGAAPDPALAHEQPLAPPAVS